MTVASKIERPKTLTDMAVERIRENIIDGTLQLGEQVSEAALAQTLGISKTPVREALLRLRSDGLVEMNPQRGTHVFSPCADDVLQICRFREVLEAAALAQALTSDRDGLIDALEENLRAMTEVQRKGNLRAVPDLDAQFHGIIVQRSNNDYLSDAYRLIEHKIHALRSRLQTTNEQLAHCQINHAAIVKQVRDGRLTQAQAILRRHIRDTQDAYLEAIPGSGAQPA